MDFTKSVIDLNKKAVGFKYRVPVVSLGIYNISTLRPVARPTEQEKTIISKGQRHYS
jgi:hypothetical protein